MVVGALTRPARRFQLVLIKPSHYDDDGYVIQWMRAFVPSNTLAVLYSLGRDLGLRQVLGPDTAIDITVIDEIHTRVKIKQLLAQFRRHDGFGLVALVGVQSNQYPRALDIARPFRAAGVPVMIGGFHVSGCLAMLPEMQADLKKTLDLGISMFAGELEGRMDLILQDAANGTLKPIYNYLKDLPSLELEPTPILPVAHLKKTFQALASFDAGRGCPYQCSFCTIINVQGRKSRRRSADDVERTIREHYVQGIRHFFITDDNLARNKDWEAIFDRIIMLRERENMNIRLMVQVDTLCHKIPNFIEKAARAGTNRVLVGLESINAANLLAAKKRQNKITEYRTMLLAWKKAGAITTAGYILGFPFDTPEFDPRGHRDHPEGAAARYPRILLPDPAAGFGRPQGAVAEGRMDARGHEPVRWRARRRPSSQDEQGRVGAGLSVRMGDLLYARAHGDDPAPRGIHRLQHVAAGELRLPVLLLRSDGKCPPLAGRSAAPEISAGSASRIADRADLVVLSEIRVELRDQICPRGATVAVAAPDRIGASKGTRIATPTPIWR